MQIENINGIQQRISQRCPRLDHTDLCTKQRQQTFLKKCSWLGDERERFRSGRAFGLQLEREEK